MASGEFDLIEAIQRRLPPTGARVRIGSGDDAAVVEPTGTAEAVTIEVDWRDGRRPVIDSARPNRLYEIEQRPSTAENAANTETSALSADSAVKLFEDVSQQLAGHVHVEPYFDDFARQPLLPNAFSQPGPGVAWDDVDGDGREDLLVGTGRGGTLAWIEMRPERPNDVWVARADGRDARRLTALNDSRDIWNSHSRRMLAKRWASGPDMQWRMNSSGTGSAKPSDGEWGPGESHSRGRPGTAPSDGVKPHPRMEHTHHVFCASLPASLCKKGEAG